MSDNEKLSCDGKPEDPALAKEFLPESEDSTPADEKAAQYWVASCANGWRGPKRYDRNAARNDANAHARQTGHNSGVLGPYNG